MSILLNRSEFLRAAGAMALFAGLGAGGRALATPKLRAYPFTLGIASGDPAPDGFVIWTRLAPRPLEEHGGMPLLAVSVRWEVAADARFSNIVRSGEAVARPELAHSVHVEVEGLRPAHPYWYRFIVEGAEASPIGAARTAPGANVLAERSRIAVAGCQAYPYWFNAWRHLSEEPGIDALFHYGDYIYEDRPMPGKYPLLDAAGNHVERLHAGGEPYSLDAYRRRYAQYKTDPDLQAAHAAFPFIVSFDDHEVDNNWASAYDQDGTPPEVFALRRFAAMQAWYEHMPVRKSLFPRADGSARYFRRLDYGSLLRMHVLDTRSHRSDQLCPKQGEANCRIQDTPDSTLLGAEQEAWLDQGLQNKARWNLIAQQVWVMPLYAPTEGGGHGPLPNASSDTWRGYPTARARLTQSINERRLTNVVIATGDAHMHAAGTVPMRDEEPDGPAAATEFLATSISSGGNGSASMTAEQQKLLDGSPNLHLLNYQRGYQIFDVSPTEWRTDLRVIDQVQQQGGSLSTLARFTVTPDRPELHRS